jgi:DNA-binding CsgD family transcriptional regulator/catechol 2,3-dioxygenase-like lactoylglutathione lyase family enzyme
MLKRGRPPHDDILTPAEWKVVEGVRHGLSNPQIAKRMGVSMDAVKYHVANALQKLGIGNRNELRHWGGINKSSLLHDLPSAIKDENLHMAVGQISRTVKNIEASREWYERVLRFRHLYTFGNLCFFDCDGVRLFLQESKLDVADSIIYFRVADVHAAHAALSERGAEFINAPHMIHKHNDGTEEWFSFFKDNEGRPLALMSHVSAQKVVRENEE